ADVIEPLHDPRRIGRLLTDGVTLHLRVKVMLLQGDNVGFCGHCAPPRVDSRISNRPGSTCHSVAERPTASATAWRCRSTSFPRPRGTAAGFRPPRRRRVVDERVVD